MPSDKKTLKKMKKTELVEEVINAEYKTKLLYDFVFTIGLKDIFLNAVNKMKEEEEEGNENSQMVFNIDEIKEAVNKIKCPCCDK
tara:strand:+ start:767 stop:1021 length:255 start_codon:yes stop_codon:yes gene_type:complete